MKNNPNGGPAERHLEGDGDITALYEWLRAPDWAEGFALADLADWADGRPTERVINLARRLRTLEAERDRYREALTPSADTKAAYMGEFRMGIYMRAPNGEEDHRSVDVPWTTIKEIMKAIGNRAAMLAEREGSDGAS